jgi:hypothetical protein
MITVTAALTHHATHHAAPGLLTLALIALAVAAAWALWLLGSPWGRCWPCSGTGTRRSPAGRPRGACRWCGGTGRRRRIGATAVHRFWWALTGDRQRTHRLDQLTRSHHDHSGHPGP